MWIFNFFDSQIFSKLSWIFIFFIFLVVLDFYFIFIFLVVLDFYFIFCVLDFNFYFFKDLGILFFFKIICNGICFYDV